MSVFTVNGLRGVSFGLVFAANCAFAALPTAGKSPSDVVAAGTERVATATTTTAAVSAPAAKEFSITVGKSTTAAVALPDEADATFLRGWMLALLAVLIVFAIKRRQSPADETKFDERALQPAAMAAPLARNQA